MYLQGRLFIILALLAACAGCRKSFRTHSTKTSAGAVDDRTLYRLEDFPCSDISLPLGITGLAWQEAEQQYQYVVRYFSTFSCAMIRDFYELDMERLGWRLLSVWSTHDSVQLLFDKPQSWCTILLSPDTIHGRQTVHIFVGPKVLRSASS